MKTLRRVIAVGALPLLVGCSGAAQDKTSRDAAFHEVFGFSPPGDVTEIESSWQKHFGQYIRWVRINCGPATLAKIRAQGRPWPDRFIILTSQPGLPAPNPEVPTWWKGSSVANEYERFVFPGSTSYKLDTVYVWVDSAAGIVYASRNVAN